MPENQLIVRMQAQNRFGNAPEIPLVMIDAYREFRFVRRDMLRGTENRIVFGTFDVELDKRHPFMDGFVQADEIDSRGTSFANPVSDSAGSIETGLPRLTGEALLDEMDRFQAGKILPRFRHQFR